MHIADHFAYLVWPGRQFFVDGKARPALEVNNLKLETLCGAMDSMTVCIMFHEWVKHYPKRFTSFNTAFDAQFLRRKPWSIHENEGFQWGPCVMRSATPFMGDNGALPMNKSKKGYKFAKLTEACQFFGVINEQPHRALGDAMAAAEIYIRLAKLQKD